MLRNEFVLTGVWGLALTIRKNAADAVNMLSSQAILCKSSAEIRMNRPCTPCRPAREVEQRCNPTEEARHAGAAVGRATLMGRKVGLLCDDPAQPEALLVCRAASELGAHVSLVRPQLEDVDEAKAAETARVLGRLYDALACVGLPSRLVLQLRERAGVLVLDHDAVSKLQPAGGSLNFEVMSPSVADKYKVAWQKALSSLE